MKLWAHRGSHGPQGPLENTMAAFEKAIVDRADGIELDVHLSMDGYPVVFHDETLERMTLSSDARPIADISADELLNIQLLGGYRMPLLSDVLDRIGPRISLNIEIKDAEAVDAVISLLDKYPGHAHLLSSFSADAVLHAFHADEGLERAWISGDLPASDAEQETSRWPLPTLARTRASRWHTSQWFCNPMTIALLAERGIQTHVWTVNDPMHARRLRIMGVHGIFTDHPGEMRKAF